MIPCCIIGAACTAQLGLLLVLSLADAVVNLCVSAAGRFLFFLILCHFFLKRCCLLLCHLALVPGKQSASGIHQDTQQDCCRHCPHTIPFFMRFLLIYLPALFLYFGWLQTFRHLHLQRLFLQDFIHFIFFHCCHLSTPPAHEVLLMLCFSGNGWFPLFFQGSFLFLCCCPRRIQKEKEPFSPFR